MCEKCKKRNNLNITELAEKTCNEVIEHYGEHNYVEFIRVVLSKLK